MAEEFAFENSLGQSAHVDREKRFAGARGNVVQRLRDEALAGAVFAGDEDVGVRRADARDDVEHRAHRGRLRDQGGAGLAAGAEELRLLLEPAIRADRAAEIDLVADDREQARVVPRLRHEIARATAHRLDGDIDAGPSRHHDDGERGVERHQFLQQLEAFRTAGGVTGVVEVHQHEREVACLDRLEGGGG